MERTGIEVLDKSASVGDSSADHEVEDYSRRKLSTSTLWTRCRRAFAAISSSFSPSRARANTEDALPLLPSGEQRSKHPGKRVSLPRVSRCLLYLLVGFFVMLCVLDSLPFSY